MTTDKTIKSKHQPKQTNVTWIDLSGETPIEKHFINGGWVAISSGGSGGTTDYSRLENKPSINGVSLNGNKTAEQFNVVSYDNQLATDIQRNIALANVSNQTANSTTGKMGYKVLDPTKTFAEQVTAENTIYEIRDVFDLNDGNVTIPEGCTLKFNGGKIFNGEILYRNTCIEGDASMEVDIDSNSTIEGGIDCCWFGIKPNDNTFDNGIIFNKILNTFKNVFINNDNVYYYSTPIIASSIKKLNFNCRMLYNGSTAINVSSIVFENCEYSDIYFKQISGYYSNVDFNNFGKTTSIRGIELLNCNDCNVTIRRFSHFNECLRLSGNSRGCCNNKITDVLATYSNVVIRLYQDNGGYINDNFFYRTRHITYSDFTKDAVCFLAYGPKWEDVNNITDTYNKCSGLIIENCDIENNHYGTNEYANLFNNAFDCRIIFSRAEAVRIACKFIGASKNNFIDVVGKAFITKALLEQESLKQDSGPILTGQTILHNIETFKYSENLVYKTGVNYAVKGMYLLNNYGTIKESAPDTEFKLNSNYKPTYNPNGIYLLPAIRLRKQHDDNIIKITASENCRFYIKYETAIVNGVEQSVTRTIDYPNPGGRIVVAVNDIYKYQADSNNYYLTLPTDIRNFYIAFFKKDAVDFNYVLQLRGIRTLLREHSLSGLFTNAPTNVPAGYIYQAIDLDKAILWSGTAWVNLDGTALS